LAKGTCSCSDASALSCSVLQKQMNQRASRHGARATKGCSERLTSAPAAALQVCQTELPSTKILHLLALAPLHETRSQAHREERRSKCLSTKHRAPLLVQLRAVGGTLSGAFFLTNEMEGNDAKAINTCAGKASNRQWGWFQNRPLSASLHFNSSAHPAAAATRRRRTGSHMSLAMTCVHRSAWVPRQPSLNLKAEGHHRVI